MCCLNYNIFGITLINVNFVGHGPTDQTGKKLEDRFSVRSNFQNIDRVTHVNETYIYVIYIHLVR